MGGLIPLRLVTIQESTKTSSISAPPIPLRSVDRRSRLSELTILPYTNLEWYKAMEEVKILYLKGQYKRCSARCVQIVEGIRDPYRVHPVYQIYLAFFAASSLELTSRSQHRLSPTKLPLLQQSLMHYQKAAFLIEPASFSGDPGLQAMRRKRKTSIGSTSSIRSSLNSIFSTHSSRSSSLASSVETSPTTSTAPQFGTSYSIFPDAVSAASISPSAQGGVHKRALSVPIVQTLTPRALKVKKNVTFSLQLQLPIRVFTVDELELASPSTLIAAFPSPPPLPSSLTPTHCQESQNSQEDPEILSTFLLSRTLSRYSSHLSTLSEQIDYHTRSVEEQIISLQTALEVAPPEITHLSRHEERYPSLQARIARLKAQGWKRKRFDGARYEELCGKALGELE